MSVLKNKLGFRHAKKRTLDEINQDYNFHAAQLGHKTRIISELDDECAVHMERLKQINKEAAAQKSPETEEAPAAEVPTGDAPAETEEVPAEVNSGAV